MRRTKILVGFTILCISILSCNSLKLSENVKYSNFPLQQKWIVQTSDDIYSIVASDGWVATATPSNLTAIDVESGNVLWAKQFDTDVDSKLLMLNEVLIATDSTSIKLIEKSGAEVGNIILDTKKGSAEVFAGIENYVFVIRRPTRTLEAYDTDKLSLAWSIGIEHEGISIYDADMPGIAYMTTLNNISAVNLSNGEILWQLPKNVIVSTYTSNILYYIGYIDNERSMYLAALNVIEGAEIWRVNISIHNNTDFLSLVMLKEALFATSQTGLIAFDRSNGSQLWESEVHDQFPVAPVLLDDVIYIKAPLTRTVHAISPDDGTSIGYLQFGATTIFSQSVNEYTSNIYVCGKTLVFSGTKMVYGYRE